MVELTMLTSISTANRRTDDVNIMDYAAEAAEINSSLRLIIN